MSIEKNVLSNNQLENVTGGKFKDAVHSFFGMAIFCFFIDSLRKGGLISKENEDGYIDKLAKFTGDRIKNTLDFAVPKIQKGFNITIDYVHDRVQKNNQNNPTTQPTSTQV